MDDSNRNLMMASLQRVAMQMLLLCGCSTSWTMGAPSRPGDKSIGGFVEEWRTGQKRARL
jgi:hypothetical protein